MGSRPVPLRLRRLTHDLGREGTSTFTVVPRAGSLSNANVPSDWRTRSRIWSGVQPSSSSDTEHSVRARPRPQISTLACCSLHCDYPSEEPNLSKEVLCSLHQLIGAPTRLSTFMQNVTLQVSLSTSALNIIKAGSKKADLFQHVDATLVRFRNVGIWSMACSNHCA